MNIAQGIDRTIGRIEDARARYQVPSAVTLELAVKTRSPEVCEQAARILFDKNLPVILGHNRVQEARDTAEAIRRVEGANIHLIGPLQKNKINHALASVDLVESIDSVELARAIDKRCSRPLPAFVQVNTSNEVSKHGCQPENVEEIVDAIAMAESLRLEGFMTVGLNDDNEQKVRHSYERLRNIRDRIAIRLSVEAGSLGLSMGMSQDLEWAIAEGATLVRVGSAIFGARTN